MRIEKDTLGEMEVPENALYGVQTARSLINFPILEEQMPDEVIKALLAIKMAAAKANANLDHLDQNTAEMIVASCQELIQNFEQYRDQFPLSIWQTGSGTQTNMNCNEVIARYILKQYQVSVHPNDIVNRSQSSNDVFPTAMHIATYQKIRNSLLPELEHWLIALTQLEKQNEGILKLGRTHLQDATPILFSQEISGWMGSILAAKNMIDQTAKAIRPLTIGGTAVGTGLNAPTGFSALVVEYLNEFYQLDFQEESNKFFGLASHQGLANVHGTCAALAGDLMKIANDIRWLASGPRGGLGEIQIPANEPGSSIMPGKVNPTQAEALTMIAVQIMGNDTTIKMACSQGNFELNAFKPVIIFNLMQSLRLLAHGMKGFREKCLVGIKANQEKMLANCEYSLMLTTALSEHIGYEQAATIAKYADLHDLSIFEAAKIHEIASDSELKEWLNPHKMV